MKKFCVSFTLRPIDLITINFGPCFIHKSKDLTIFFMKVEN